MHCWGTSRLGADPPPPLMSDERSRLYDSVFTYNTERQFRNTYSTYVTPEEIGNNESALTPSKMLELFVMVLSALLITMTLPFSLFFTVKLISANERLVITRFGRSRGVKEPGVAFVLPLIDHAVRMDIRVQSFELPAFQVVTVDRGLVEVGVVVFSRVVDLMKAHLCLQNREETLRSLSYNVSYNNLAKRTQADLTDPDTLARILDKAKEEFNQFCQNLGVEVTQIAVRQLRVVKPAENQAVSLFNTLMKSELGEQLMRVLAPALQAYMTPTTTSQSADGQQAAKRSADEDVSMTDAREPKPNLVFSLNPQIELQSTATKSNAGDACDAIGREEIVVDAEIDDLFQKVRSCCDEQLVSRVDRRYLIYVKYDRTEVFQSAVIKDSGTDEEDRGASHGQSFSDCMGVLDLDLRVGQAGSCRWLGSTETDQSLDCGTVSRFALQKSTLLALAAGTISPFGAYLNGAVEIVEGTITDAIPLRHLADRAAAKTME